MIVLSGGCSFVWGIDLADCRHSGPGGFSRRTWPALLADDIGATYHSVASPGAGNDIIARNVISHCETKQKPDVVIVQWTFPWRFGFRFGYPTNANREQWSTIDLWSIDNEYKPVDRVIDETDQMFGYSEKMREIARTVGTKEFANIFFKHVAYEEYWSIYTSLKEIVALQNYLKVKNIPYLFSCADNVLFECATAVTPPDVYLKSLQSQLDKNSWFMFSRGDKSHETQTPRGFYQWAEENKYPKGISSHPLEAAHSNAAELIKEKFNEMVKKHLEQNCSGNSIS